jgi:hypothetical protein
MLNDDAVYLSGTKGTVWHDTAIDVYSAHTWAFLRSTSRYPRPGGISPSRGAAGYGRPRSRR